MGGRFQYPVQDADAVCPQYRTVLLQVIKSNLLSCSVLELMDLMLRFC